MFNIKNILILLITFILLSACGKDKIRKSVVGSWNCEEHYSNKSIRTYQVNIEKDPVNPKFYKIYNFNNLGSDVSNIILCEKIDNKLIINNYSVGNGVVVKNGEGIIASDFSQIDWEYNMIEYSGLEVYVKAKFY